MNTQKVEWEKWVVPHGSELMCLIGCAGGVGVAGQLLFALISSAYKAITHTTHGRPFWYTGTTFVHWALVAGAFYAPRGVILLKRNPDDPWPYIETRWGKVWHCLLWSGLAFVIGYQASDYRFDHNGRRLAEYFIILLFPVLLGVRSGYTTSLNGDVTKPYRA